MADMFLPSRLSHLYPCWILQPQCLLFTPAFKHLFPYSSLCGCHHIQILETSLVLSLLRPISMLSPVQRMAVLLSARTEETHKTSSCWKWSQASWNQESSEPPTFCHGKKYSVLRVGPGPEVQNTPEHQTVTRSCNFTSVFTILHTVFLYEPVLPFITWYAMISS